MSDENSVNSDQLPVISGEDSPQAESLDVPKQDASATLYTEV